MKTYPTQDCEALQHAIIAGDMLTETQQTHLDQCDACTDFFQLHQTFLYADIPEVTPPKHVDEMIKQFAKSQDGATLITQVELEKQDPAETYEPPVLRLLAMAAAAVAVVALSLYFINGAIFPDSSENSAMAKSENGQPGELVPSPDQAVLLAESVSPDLLNAIDAEILQVDGSVVTSAAEAENPELEVLIDAFDSAELIALASTSVYSLDQDLLSLEADLIWIDSLTDGLKDESSM